MTVARKMSLVAYVMFVPAVRKIANEEATSPRPINMQRRIFSPRGRYSFGRKVRGINEKIRSVETCTALAATMFPVIAPWGTQSTCPSRKILGSQYMLNGRHCRNWKKVEVTAVRMSKTIVPERKTCQTRVCLMRIRSRATDILTNAIDQYQHTWQMKIRRMAERREDGETYVEGRPKPWAHATHTMTSFATASI